MRGARVSGDVSGYFDRLSNDGNIVQFRKDGTTVGSIGSVASGANLYISAATGVGLGIGGDNIYPVNASGASTNASLDIGDASARFKDLYLSGGVFLGGTGNANKLHDYEEGTFTATWTGTGTSGPSATMKYTKIGNTVNIVGATLADAITPTGAIELSGLPFTPNAPSSGSILYRNITATSGQHTLVAYVPQSTANIQLYWSAQGTYAKLQKSQINASGAQDMYIGVTYTTDA